MGLFDFLKKPSQITISLKQFGHASADWSINLAVSLVEDISKYECDKNNSSSLVSSLKGSPFTTQLIFGGLYAACYRIYATRYLDFSQDAAAVEKFTDGLRDGLLALNYPPPFTTNNDKEALTNQVLGIASMLADALDHDLQLDDPRQEILYPTVSKIIHKIFNLEEGAQDPIAASESLFLYHLITPVPTNLFVILKDTHKRIDNMIQIQLPND